MNTSPPDRAAPIVAGINHVAIVTADIERFVAFYRDVFELEVVFEETTPAFRHAMLLVAPGAVLHPMQLAGNPHGAGLPDLANRGHIDHLALTVADADAFQLVISRLVARGASDGDVGDLGAVHSIWFTDPDGMRGEIVLVLDPLLAGIHEPRPLAAVR